MRKPEPFPAVEVQFRVPAHDVFPEGRDAERPPQPGVLVVAALDSGIRRKSKIIPLAY